MIESNAKNLFGFAWPTLWGSIQILGLHCEEVLHCGEDIVGKEKKNPTMLDIAIKIPHNVGIK